ncbi:hypothetical protein EVAR_283_1 [Eumeta japonica]|uniref:Uncharacterized protein n=1 Tax=Eumeta variegata TaxID=151549 RepID=A0A4C1S9H8_EUMVA|nr:hypothetical protein EVAR_283_1 [Eumeta japonica]
MYSADLRAPWPFYALIADGATSRPVFTSDRALLQRSLADRRVDTSLQLRLMIADESGKERKGERGIARRCRWPLIKKDKAVTNGKLKIAQTNGPLPFTGGAAAPPRAPLPPRRRHLPGPARGHVPCILRVSVREADDDRLEMSHFKDTPYATLPTEQIRRPRRVHPLLNLLQSNHHQDRLWVGGGGGDRGFPKGNRGSVKCKSGGWRRPRDGVACAGQGRAPTRFPHGAGGRCGRRTAPAPAAAGRDARQ